MRAHIIEKGVVVNTIEVESLDFMPNLVEATEGGIGWSYDGQSFSPPPEPPPEVTESVTMRQARLALHKSNLLTQVDSALDSLPEPERTEAKIEWEYATTVERASPLVKSLVQSLNMSEQDIDNLFILANTL